MGQESGDDAIFIHNLKVRLTAISGYAQLLERQNYESEYSTAKQREYIARLRHVIDDLSRTIREHEADSRAQRERQVGSERENDTSQRRNSDCMSY